ncbi:MAG TPA: M15 family metallopeptidase [Candidatus Acidoferrum sp.]|nr:M15 family metallopeptidase [Candidatus Acidoferrum sp.]
MTISICFWGFSLSPRRDAPRRTICSRQTAKKHFPPHRFAWALTLLGFLAQAALAQSADSLLPGPKPPDAPGKWKPSIGDYATEAGILTVLERGGAFYVVGKEVGELRFNGEEGRSDRCIARDRENGLFVLTINQRILRESRRQNDYERFPIDYSSHPGANAAKEIATLRHSAIKSAPPTEAANFHKPDLVELAPLDPAIHLDVRYATANDFLGAPVYTQARAFLQRPAAEALLRVLHKLQPLGYGLLIYDGYRPWYVTKIFWDATPQAGKIFVADPAQGSRHNRGCAVDLTLYDLKTGQPVEMTGAYDEMSPRSFPNYPGGTSLQRWNRDLLRRAMESEGFTVYESEWWHFDYKDWHEYGILNVPFEKLGIGSATK